jgi:hypothetical protein
MLAHSAPPRAICYVLSHITIFICSTCTRLLLSCCHFVVVYGLLMASPLRYTDETKILYTKWHIEYLLDMPNWLPETFEGQEGHPYIGDPYGHPTSYRMFECPAQACQFKVLVHTLSFRPIVALILALRRSPRSQRPKNFWVLKWFLLT